MILSILKLPYQITPDILRLITAIAEKMGEIKAVHLYKLPVQLRKKNRIKTIQSSLQIEGNALSESQITALLEHKRVIAPQKDILEVQNALKAYDQLPKLNPHNPKHLQKVHKILMQGLVENAGKLRTASRDLKWAVEKNILHKKGAQRLTTYHFKTE